ncbi:MAG: hypothetical protein R6V67_00590 [Spirochaetia bacterium]
MFIFWGPFFFLFPALLIYLVVRTLLGSSGRGGNGHHSSFTQDGRFDPFGLIPPGPGGEGQSPQVRVYQLAYRLKGTITVSDIVVETGLEVEEAERLIQSMVDNQRVRMEVRDDGVIFYDFPEIISRYGGDGRDSR